MPPRDLLGGEFDESFSLFRKIKSRQMALVLALGKERSLRKASAALGMTQPSATKSLQDLEHAIGFQLFVRGRRGMQPTNYGEAVIRHAHLVVSDLDRTRHELESLASGAMGRVRIGAVISAIPVLLARAVARLKEEHPRLAISIEVGTSDVLVTMLTAGELDVLLARPLVLADRPEFDYEELIAEPLHIVARCIHSLAKRKRLALRDLAGYSWALLPSGAPMRAVLEPVFAEIGPGEPLNVVETSSMMSMIALMQESEMLAVMPADVTNFGERHGLLRRLPIDLPPIMGSYGIVTRRDRSTSPGTATFLRHLRATMNASK